MKSLSKICPLFSGSTGNSTYIGTEKGSLLIDAGASMKSICAAIECAGGDYSEIKAVAVTHEHIDHVKGLKTFLKNTGVPIIASEKTLSALAKADRLPSGARVIPIGSESVEIGGISIGRFATSHDCDGSSGYVVTLPDGKKVSVCTDLGVVTDEVRNALDGSFLTVIESNHDIEMLKHGPYPPVLKMRILSERGHISNNACACELPNLLKSGTTRFILAHLSLKNNVPMLAKKTAEAALMDIGAENGRDYILSVASPEGNRVSVI